MSPGRRYSNVSLVAPLHLLRPDATSTSAIASGLVVSADCDAECAFGKPLDRVLVPVGAWAPEFGGRNGFPPPEKNELVLSITMGCADTVPFQPKPNTPF